MANYISHIGFLLIIVGILIILLALALAALHYKEEKSGIKGGGIILIGSFPIIFGSDIRIVKILIYLILLMLSFMIIFILASKAEFLR